MRRLSIIPSRTVASTTTNSRRKTRMARVSTSELRATRSTLSSSCIGFGRFEYLLMHGMDSARILHLRKIYSNSTWLSRFLISSIGIFIWMGILWDTLKWSLTCSSMCFQARLVVLYAIYMLQWAKMRPRSRLNSPFSDRVNPSSAHPHFITLNSLAWHTGSFPNLRPLSYYPNRTMKVGDNLDYCFNNLVRGNTISTNGNECVDIKEGSRENIVEDNSCTRQLDRESGCYNVRGDDNIIRYNGIVEYEHNLRRYFLQKSKLL